MPDGASLSTYHSMVPHVAHRKLIYQFPNPFRVVLYGPDTSMEEARACLPEANDLEYVLLQKSLSLELQLEWEHEFRDDPQAMEEIRAAVSAAFIDAFANLLGDMNNPIIEALHAER